MTKEKLGAMTKEEFEAMTKEEFISLIKDCIMDCVPLCDSGNVQGCMDKITAINSLLATWSKANAQDYLYKSTCDITNEPDIRIKTLNNIINYIETTAWYMDGTGFVTPVIFESYIDHIAEVDELDEMDRCYILTNIVKNNYIPSCTQQIIARGLFKMAKPVAKSVAKIDWEKCVDLANKRLRDVVTAANKADAKEMESLMLSSMCGDITDFE